MEAEGKTHYHEFDAVSEDGKIVAEVKAYTKPYFPQEMDNALSNVSTLNNVDAGIKLFFLTDPLFYVAFCRKHKDNLVEIRKQGIEIVPPFELSNYLEV